MSSILKALKQLEGQASAKIALKSGSQALDTGKVVQTMSSPGREAKLKIFAYCLLFVGMVVVLGYFVLQNQGEKLESDSVEVFTNLEQDSTTAQSDSARLEEIKDLQRRQQSNVQREPTQMSESTKRVPHSESFGEGRKMYSESLAKPFNGVEVSGHTILKAETTADMPAIEKAKSERVETKEVVSSAETEQFDEPVYSRLDYAILELQAITWSVKPQERFALVENKILRTGESIKGYTIDSIHEGHVVVRQGSEKWRVEFRLR